MKSISPVPVAVSPDSRLYDYGPSAPPVYHTEQTHTHPLTTGQLSAIVLAGVGTSLLVSVLLAVVVEVITRTKNTKD